MRPTLLHWFFLAVVSLTASAAPPALTIYNQNFAVVRDTVMSLARHGFTRFFFVNGHGGNIATVTAAFSEIYAERSMQRMSRV